MSSAVGAHAPRSSPSLYVGDLLAEVNEAALYEVFNSVGPVASIKVCRDASTRTSLGYAYVNYHSISDAERALETLNYTPIKGNPCRIMWSQRDPTIRKSNAGNLFVKNLDKTVDNRALHDTFSLFGNILSCKVVTDDQGKSRGYGFVHFETDEAATAAIERVNGMKIGAKEVYVGHHQKRSDRPSGRATFFTNLYVRDFPRQWTETTVQKIFGAYGTITSIWLSSDSKGRPFACVNYQEANDAKKALMELNGKKVDANGLYSGTEEESKKKTDDDATSASENKLVDTLKQSTSEEDIKTLYVDRAQDRSERHQVVHPRVGKTQQFRTKYEGANLYIKNLSDTVTDEGLRAMFEPFGTITSVKVMKDEDGHSKGFGFVCFTTTEEATKAIADMHLRIHDNKPLYVGLAEQKERRQARLQNHFRTTARPTAPLMQQPPANYGLAPAASVGGGNNYFGGNVVPPSQTGGQQWISTWQTGPIPQPPPGNLLWKANPYVQATNSAVHPGSIGPPIAVYPQQHQMAHHQFPREMPAPQQAQGVKSSTLDPRLGDMTIPPQVRKQLLGEHLFPLVSRFQPELAGKITGMMLDMDEPELHILISSETELKAKIEEALSVLATAGAQYA